MKQGKRRLASDLLRACLVLSLLPTPNACRAAEEGGDAAVNAKDEDPRFARISGRVYHESDVATVPSAPYERGLVVAVPRSRLVALLRDRGGERTSARPRVPVAEADVASLAQLEGDGSYSLSLPPGDYALCVSRLGERSVSIDRFPVVLDGCVDLRLSPGETRRTDLHYGIGGLRTR